MKYYWYFEKEYAGIVQCSKIPMPGDEFYIVKLSKRWEKQQGYRSGDSSNVLLKDAFIPITKIGKLFYGD